MPKWTYYLTVVNELDRPLELISENLAWGRKEKRAISLASLPPAQMQNTVCILLRVPPRGLNST